MHHDPSSDSDTHNYYEAVSRRDRPRDQFDLSLDTHSLRLETASAELEGMMRTDFPMSPEHRLMAVVFTAIEALGILRDAYRIQYASLILDLFKRDPINSLIRADYDQSVIRHHGK